MLSSVPHYDLLDPISLVLIILDFNIPPASSLPPDLDLTPIHLTPPSSFAYPGCIVRLLSTVPCPSLQITRTHQSRIKRLVSVTHTPLILLAANRFHWTGVVTLTSALSRHQRRLFPPGRPAVHLFLTPVC